MAFAAKNHDQADRADPGNDADARSETVHTSHLLKNPTIIRPSLRMLFFYRWGFAPRVMGTFVSRTGRSTSAGRAGASRPSVSR